MREACQRRRLLTLLSGKLSAVHAAVVTCFKTMVTRNTATFETDGTLSDDNLTKSAF